MKATTSYPKEKMKVLILEDIHRNASKVFRQNGYSNIKRYSSALAGKELETEIKDAHIIGIRSKTKLTAAVLEKAEKLLAIGCFCIGTNQVDLKAATMRGIPVFNSPYSNTRSVAELVLAESILLMRRIPERDKAAHEGTWLKDAKGSFEIRGKTIGIVGYGHIGTQVSVLAEALGLKVLFYDVIPKLPLGNAVACKTMAELMKNSDIVTLHVPADKGTENLINARTLKHMKKGSILLNLARGSVVDQPALAAALKSKQLAGAAIDVYPVEPKNKSELLETPLQGIPNVILTPHIGGSTVEAQQNIGLDVAAKLAGFLDSGASVGSHSVPALSLPVKEKSHRILHIHHNEPGVLSEINAILAENKINIAGQYLNTNASIGYVVLDVSGRSSRKLLNSMREVKHTIRTRVLY